MSRLSRQITLGLIEPALQGRWYCSFPELAQQQNTIIVESVTPTFGKIPAIPRFYGGSNRYYPGVKDIDGLQVVLYETHDFYTTRWLNDWRKKIYDDETQNYGLPKDYWKEVIVDLYGVNDSDTPAMQLKYKECWPTDQQAFQLNYTEMDGRLTVQVNLSVNNGEIVIQP